MIREELNIHVALDFSTVKPSSSIINSISILEDFTILALTYREGEAAWAKLVVHTAGAYPGFLSMKPTRSIDGMGCYSIAGYPQHFVASTHLYSWVKRGTVRVKCLTQEHNIMTPASA